MPLPGGRESRSIFRASRNLMARALEIEIPSMYPEDFELPIYIFQNGAALFMAREDNTTYIAGQSLAGENPQLHFSEIIHDAPTVDVPYAHTTFFRFHPSASINAVNPSVPPGFNPPVGEPIMSPPSQYRTDNTWWSITLSGVGTNPDIDWTWTGSSWLYENIAANNNIYVTSTFNPLVASQWVDFRPISVTLTFRQPENLPQSVHITLIETSMGTSGPNPSPELFTDAHGLKTMRYTVPSLPDTPDFNQIVITHDLCGIEPLELLSLKFDFVSPPIGDVGSHLKYPNQMMESTARFCIRGYTPDKVDVQEAFKFLVSRMSILSPSISITYQLDRSLFIDAYIDPLLD